MASQPTPILHPWLLAGGVLLASVAVSPATVPARGRIALPGLSALGFGLILFRSRQVHARQKVAEAETRATAAEARVRELTRSAAQMRHDLRGILSPALLTADRLAMSQDPASRRAGEAMITTVERAEKCLRD